MAVNTKNLLIASIAMSGVSLALSAYGAYKMYKAAKTLDAKIDDLAEGIDIDIPDVITQKAMEKAARDAANRAASDAARSITREFSSDVRQSVSEAVKKEKAALQSEIKDEIKRKVGEIDISDAKAEVVAEAKQEVSERLSRELEGIKAEYNQHLKDVSDIYSSIAKSMKSAAV